MKKIILFIAVSLIGGFTKAQNVGINSTGVAPDASAMLDVNVSGLGANAKKGLLAPRVALLSTTDATTIPAPAVSLLIYNSATSGVSPNNVYPGFYYWDGVKWVRYVDFTVERLYYPPTNINTGFAYNLVATIPGCTPTSSSIVNLVGDWAVAPGLSISYSESRNGQVRFRVINTSGTNYVGVDFIITVIR